ncbi:MAG TPA: sporulation integral membrane protein YtvI [Clostridiales bacterium]|nr:sporulation integral membrane protein YtvI [Clostridiales bacterium]HPP68034.1 sporulation integral membrane protein YtvI [Clostridiales bacterium]
MNRTERRRKFIIDVFFWLIIIAAFYLFMKIAFWYVFPFVFAFFLTMSLQKPIEKITKVTRLKPGFVGTALVLLITALALFIVFAIGVKLTNELKSFAQYLTQRVNDIPAIVTEVENWLLRVISFLPDSLEQAAANFIRKYAESIRVPGVPDSSLDLSWLKSPLGSVWETAKQIPSIVLALVVTVVSSCFMATSYKEIKEFIYRQISEEKGKKLSQTKTVLFSTLGKMAKAYCLLMLITFSEISIGLGLLKVAGIYEVNYILVIAIVTALVDIVPVLGTGTILIPWSAYLLITGEFGGGIGLLVMYAIITVIRQIIEPKLVADQVGLPPVVTIMSMYIGAKVFGPIGIFLLPIIVILIKLLNDKGIIKIFKTSNSEHAAEETAKEESV